ncbi:hypothetical protein AGMMS49579_22560 [Spirochaetia bacterium]|nr:hypothetical protein AGMMS49579_22560 [Spirochaetia bacterium]
MAAEIIFDDNGIIRSFTDDTYFLNVVKEGNMYIAKESGTSSGRDREHFIKDDDGIITVWWNTTMQPIAAIITENTARLETGERLNLVVNNNSITWSRFVLSYKDGGLARIEDPDEFLLYTVSRQSPRQCNIEVISPGISRREVQIWANTTQKTMRQNAINLLIILFVRPVEYIPFIIGRY